MREHNWVPYQTKPGYHRWRHRTHIGPLLDKDGRDRLFYDLGANAGYHMREAEKLGYRAIGIDGCAETVALSPDLELTQGDINYLKPLPAHTTLLSCVHYHQSPEQVDALFHALSYTTVYAIVMGRHRGKPRSNPSKQHLIDNHLRGYKILKEIPSRNFYSMLLKNRRCEEFNVDELYEATRGFYQLRLPAGEYDDWVPAFENFVKHSLDDMEYEDSNSDWMKYLNRSRVAYKMERCWRYKRMIQEIRERGLTTALKVHGDHLSDGMHRLVILRELGGTRVVCRV